MSASKPSSYPSRQLRGGPAPLASFEDLSDEIQSPDDDRLAVDFDDDGVLIAGTFDLEDDETDEGRTCSEGATPSTPRVLAQTPSTPLALDYDFSAAGTPDSLDRRSNLHFEAHDSGSRSVTPPSTALATFSESRGSLHSSPRHSPLFGRRSKGGATPDSLRVSCGGTGSASATSTETLDGGRDTPGSSESVVRVKHPSGKPGTPSPRSARKLFTMSFFKPRDERCEKTPSPMLSPKSPRRQSPPASSPKSPRKPLAFGNLFKSSSSVKEEGGDLQVQQQSSPSKKRSHFPHFLRANKEDKKTTPTQEVAAPPGEPGRKEGRHGGRVFSTLFRRDHRDGGTTTVGKQIPLRSSQTPEDEEWIPPSKVQATAPKQVAPVSKAAVRSMPVAAPTIPAVSPFGPVSSDPLRSELAPPQTRVSCDIPNGEFRAKSENSHFITTPSPPQPAGEFSSSDYDPTLQLGFSPSVETPQDATATLMTSVDATNRQLGLATTTDTVSTSEDDQSRTALTVNQPATTNRKISPESEAGDVPELDPTVLKALKGEEPEAETLLREDSFENEDGPDVSDLLRSASSKSTEKEEVAKHRDKVAAFRANPVDRPRCTAPVSIASLEAYINIVAQPVGSASVEVTSPDKAKLKVILPGEEFGHKSRQPKKPVYKSWSEFCEVGLQSPRSRRRQQLGDHRSSRSPSSVPASRETTIEEDDRRTESLDFGFSPASWTTFDQASPHVRHVPLNGTTAIAARHPQSHHPSCPSSSSFQVSSSDSTPEDPYFTYPVPQVPVEECPCECHVSEIAPPNGEAPAVPDSSPSSDGHSPKDVPCSADADGVFLRDEEVEPLVQEASEDFLVNQDADVGDLFSSFAPPLPPRRQGDYEDNDDDYAMFPSVIADSFQTSCLGEVNLGYGDEDSDWGNGMSPGEVPECITSMIQSDNAWGRDSSAQHLDALSGSEDRRPGLSTFSTTISVPPDPVSALRQPPQQPQQHWSCGVDLLTTLPPSTKQDSSCPPLIAAHRGSRGPPPPPPPRSNLTSLHHHHPRVTSEPTDGVDFGSAPPALPARTDDSGRLT